MSASATEVCAATKGLSLTKLYSGSPELFFNQVFTFGLLCLSPHCPILGRILLSQLNQNPTPFISDHPPYLIRSLILHHPQGVSDHPGRPSARILLGQFSQNPPYPWCLLLVVFHPRTPPCSLSITPTCPRCTQSWAQIPPVRPQCSSLYVYLCLQPSLNEICLTVL